MSTSARYQRFAEVEAAGSSPIYEALATAISRRREVLERLDTLPEAKRQPNLLFAACQYLQAPTDDPDSCLEFVLRNWAILSGIIRRRSTQTNEAARTAMFLPVLATLPQPLALIEVGASAGLCLYPDRYRIRYGDTVAVGPADSPVTIDVDVFGSLPMPAAPIAVAWRAGVDLNPLDVSNPDDLGWLMACIWPEHGERRARLTAAARVVASDPPDIRRGDLLDHLDGLLADVPSNSTPVVFHSAVLNYLDEPRRREFARRLRAYSNVVWISNEGPGVVAGVDSSPDPPEGMKPDNFFVLALEGTRALAVSDPHGRWLRWGE